MGVTANYAEQTSDLAAILSGIFSSWEKSKI